jgi:hypothetical protein
MDHDWRGLRLAWCLLPGGAALFFGIVLLSAHRQPEIPVTSIDGELIQKCSFREITSWPCPLCGFTRGSAAFLRGDLRRSWAFHPVAALTCASLVAAAIIGAWAAWRVPRPLPATLSRALWLLALVQPALFLANWLWRLWH